MKENTLEVLFYLFENYFEVDGEHSEDRHSLNTHLQYAGFMPEEIARAFDWLESLGDEYTIMQAPRNKTSLRIFSSRESCWLNPECQSYLLFLEQAGIINFEAREQIIEHALLLEDDEFNLDKLKWVTLMVLLNRPEDESSVFWVDGQSLDGVLPVYH